MIDRRFCSRISRFLDRIGRTVVHYGRKGLFTAVQDTDTKIRSVKKHRAFCSKIYGRLLYSGTHPGFPKYHLPLANLNVYTAATTTTTARRPTKCLPNPLRKNTTPYLPRNNGEIALHSNERPSAGVSASFARFFSSAVTYAVCTPGPAGGVCVGVCGVGGG